MLCFTQSDELPKYGCNMNMSLCDSNAICVDMKTSFDCVCNDHYTGDGTYCNDVDECGLNTHNCSRNATCLNTPGSHTCTCDEGFAGNGTFCRDVSCPALPTLPNSAVRINNLAKILVVGNRVTFECTHGFEISLNRETRDIECVEMDGRRSWNIGNGNNCSDIDECKSADSPCRGNQQCNNTLGGFRCDCLGELFKDHRGECSGKINIIIKYTITQEFNPNTDKRVRGKVTTATKALLTNFTIAGMNINTKSGSILVTIGVDVALADVGMVNGMLDNSIKGGSFAGFPVDPASFSVKSSDTYACLPGQEADGIAACKKCQKGYFKELSDRSKCTYCGQGRTTSDIGTLFENDCLRVCAAGSYLSKADKSGQCIKCPENTFRNHSNSELTCVKCRNNHFTQSTGSDTIGKCNDTCAADAFMTEKYCKNSGVCTFNVPKNKPMCNCPLGFSGTTCTVKVTVITSVDPLFGPKAGGTFIKVSGIHLNHTDGPTIYLNDTKCIIYNSSDSIITCNSEQGAAEGDTTIKIKWTETNTTKIYMDPFVYKPDPEVKEIYPLESLITGGTTVTVNGTNLDSVSKPLLLITIRYITSVITEFEFSGPCRHTENQLECETPSLNGTNGLNRTVLETLIESVAKKGKPASEARQRRRRLLETSTKPTVEVFFDIMMDRANVTKRNATILLNPEVKRKQDFNFRPFWPFSDNKFDLKGSELPLNLQSDLAVHIGDGQCKEVKILASNLLECRPSTSRPSKGKHNSKHGNWRVIKVTIGTNLEFTVGYVDFQENILDYPPGRIGIIIGVLLVVVFIAMTAFFVCWYRRQKRRLERHPDNLHRLQRRSSSRQFSVYSSEGSLLDNSEFRGTGYHPRSMVNHRRRGALDSYYNYSHRRDSNWH